MKLILRYCCQHYDTMDDHGKYHAKYQNAWSENPSSEWDYKMLEQFK